MVELSDDELIRLHKLGQNVALALLRKKNVTITDLISSEIESITNEVLAVSLKKFLNRYNLQFDQYFIMNIHFCVMDFMRDWLGRTKKQKIKSSSQHVAFDETVCHNIALLLYEHDDILVKSIDKHNIFLSLPEKQRRILSLISAGYLEDEIGQIVGGVTKQRINQIKQEAITNAQKIISTATPIKRKT